MILSLGYSLIDTSLGYRFNPNQHLYNTSDVEIPLAMQRAMAKEAEAIREKRARIIKAAAEQEASIKLAEASQLITENPIALELRRLQMLTEIGAENNTATFIVLPSDVMLLAKRLSDSIQDGNIAQKLNN